MASRWLPLLNHLLCGLIVLLLVGAFIFWLRRPSDINTLEQLIVEHAYVQKNAFEMPKAAYASISESIFPLDYYPPTMQLPDLRQLVIYYGKNGRPDAQAGRTTLHFGIKGIQTTTSVSPGEKVYFQYQPKPSQIPYVFSPHNQPSSLWMEASLVDNEALVKVFMKNEKGVIVQDPSAYAEFRLPEKELLKAVGGANTWQIGPHRVDGTLLARQHAKWYGKDAFLEVHGGDEFKALEGKQRIDFGEGSDIYSVFMANGDILIWENEKWKQVTPGPLSQGRPLLAVRKVDDRLMTFELWDVEGKGKVIINILKSNEAWAASGPQMLQRIFKFVGARKRSQFIFEIDEARMLLSPGDWLLYTEEGWKKLADAQDIDDYVSRKKVGLLFVFEGITRKGDHQVLIGKMYNSTRSEMLPVELAILQGGTLGEAESEEGEENPHQVEKIDKIRYKDIKKLRDKKISHEGPNQVDHDEI